MSIKLTLFVRDLELKHRKNNVFKRAIRFLGTGVEKLKK